MCYLRCVGFEGSRCRDGIRSGGGGGRAWEGSDFPWSYSWRHWGIWTFVHTWVRQRERRKRDVGIQACAGGEGTGPGSPDASKGGWACQARLLLLPVALDSFYLVPLNTLKMLDCQALLVGAKRARGLNFPEGEASLVWA